MNRFELLNLLQNTIQDELVICNIGLPSQELYKINDRPNYFYMLGSMGLASSIGLGLSLAVDKNVISIINVEDSNSNKPIELSTEKVTNFSLYLKVFNFNNYSEIQSIMDNISIDLMYTSEKNGSFYNLTIGPIDKNEMNNLVSYFISKGYKETKIILS